MQDISCFAYGGEQRVNGADLSRCLPWQMGVRSKKLGGDGAVCMCKPSMLLAISQNSVVLKR